MNIFDHILRSSFQHWEYTVRDFCIKRPSTEHFYKDFLVPIEKRLMKWNNYYFFDRLMPVKRYVVSDVFKHFLLPEQTTDRAYCTKLADDYTSCYLLYRINSIEYFLYDFEHLPDEERKKYLSDKDRWRILHQRFPLSLKQEHSDKYFFYEMTKPYFHREAFLVNDKASKDEFVAFATRHPRFFVKHNVGCFGADAHIMETLDQASREAAFEELKTAEGDWIVEELIQQADEMAAWNDSSVNTVRIPSFLTKDGDYHILVPILRTGRKGSVIDNAAGGGIMAGIDISTGKILSKGRDKKGSLYDKHPETGITYLGWQVPRWQELVALCEEIHRTCLSKHRYIAFDFALSPDHWMLVEGNWGQISGQGAAHQGIRNEFLEYIRQ